MKLSDPLKIMIVDDEDDIRTIAAMALELTADFVVALAASGQQAIDEAPAFGPDIILLDFMMPGMDGPSTLRVIQSHTDLSRVPIVFMTGKVQPDEVASCLAMGAVAVISKPFDAMKLAEQIQNIWDTGQQVLSTGRGE